MGLTRDQNKVMTTTKCARSVRKREGTSPEIRPMAPWVRVTSWSRDRGLWDWKLREGHSLSLQVSLQKFDVLRLPARAGAAQLPW